MYPIITRSVPVQLGRRIAKPSLTLTLRTVVANNGSKRWASSVNSLTKTQLPFTYSPNGPKIVKYTKDHEWIAAHEDGIAFIGISKYASDSLGDATYIELPEVDTIIEEGESMGSVESVKSASEIYQPVKGEVVEVNTELENKPQLINQDPMGLGWIAKIKLDSMNDIDSSDKLLSLDQYEESLKHDD
ncbi:glycine decarboxylase subunit H NDAI_0H01930 [Naumovozyma dairenensis CBS 421]|uniref:Glycine cleavage system H protein n=1 Tax=Naumovozyma dairenensis (strain ATCC 10597 / BCRC 20456 / CBS 421 / NBRC 0211 / NRRL Y-12639) TaxID=1071378 RepID=G0WF06_NAUDC|nr:hypothetical protein NDAI_0H01930 [Naumovozyma dairenensis CBS 421]CCD26367.1 hypothetical protein NDAI_0H01930 [Naumovozyma dairenensis CBS 421]